MTLSNQMLHADIRPLVLIDADHRHVKLTYVLIAEHNRTVFDIRLNGLPVILNRGHDDSVCLLGLKQIEISQLLVFVLVRLADQRLIAVLVPHLLDSIQQIGEKRIHNLRNHYRDCSRKMTS
ncbi:hypothetical protein D3C75_1006330 [compost metagenome]